jgi:hypothetical protein
LPICTTGGRAQPYTTHAAHRLQGQSAISYFEAPGGGGGGRERDAGHISSLPRYIGTVLYNTQYCSVRFLSSKIVEKSGVNSIIQLCGHTLAKSKQWIETASHKVFILWMEGNFSIHTQNLQ